MIGRKKEIDELISLYQSPKAELVHLYNILSEIDKLK